MVTATPRPTRRSRPTNVEDLHRLADLGRQRGLRVFEASPGRWFCSSASDQFALHVVTGLSCTCEGFLRHQRCSHNSLLLSELGWLPPQEPEPPAVVEPIRCPECLGCGVVYVHQCELAGFPHPNCTCCDGTGRLPVTIIAA